MRVAQCLEYLPLIDASFEAGEISYSRARLLVYPTVALTKAMA
jgi:hypothetical protein